MQVALGQTTAARVIQGLIFFMDVTMRQGLSGNAVHYTLLFSCLLLVSLAGCSLLPQPVVKVIEEYALEEPLELSLLVDPQVNPDLNGRPSPMVLRIYQLKRDLQFRSSDFFSLYDNDIKVLSADLVGRDEYVLNPGQLLEIELGLNQGVRYLAFLGAFSDLDNAVAKLSIAVDADDPEPLRLLLTASRLRLLDEDVYENLVAAQQSAARPLYRMLTPQ
ncbi:MAG: type VI secretion system protein VasD [Motiliproteus sp.]